MTLIEYINQRGIDDKPTLQTVKIDYLKSLKDKIHEDVRQQMICHMVYEDMLDVIKEAYVIDGCKCAIGNIRLTDVRC